MKILSIQVGQPKTIQFNGKPIETAILKMPVDGPVYLKKLNLEGDKQADLKVHGGLDKALYAYSFDCYPWWRSTRPNTSFNYGAMGENVSMDHLPEDQIFIGDVFELGAATIQVTQPRFPCFKLAAMYNDNLILKQFLELNRPGVYFRVLKEGSIQAGDALKLITKEKVRVSVQELFEIKIAVAPKSRLKTILEIESLNENWRSKIKAQYDLL